MFSFGASMILGRSRRHGFMGFPTSFSMATGSPLTGTFHLLVDAGNDTFVVSLGGDNLDWASP